MDRRTTSSSSGSGSGSSPGGNGAGDEARHPPLSGCASGFPPAEAEIARFDNGFECLVRVDRSAPVCSVQAWVRTGSILEGRFRGSGISHLVEHLVFKGSERRSASRLARDVQDVGGYINAYTSFDRTVYWVDAPREGMATALEVVADLASGATFPEVEFEREKDVIRREIDMGRDDPGRRSGQLLFETAFREHPFREPIIGHLSLFNRLTLDEVRGYYQERYVPNNMFLVVAGDVEIDEVIDLARRRFGHLERGKVDGFFVPPEPPQLGMRQTHEGFDTELTKFHLAWRVPGLTHRDMPALDVLAHILGGGRSSRLYRRVREEASLVHGIGAHAYTPSSEGLFIIAADCDPDRRDEAMRLALDVAAEVARDGLCGEELEKSRRAALAAQLESLVTARGQASDLASNWHLVRNLLFTGQYLEAVNALTEDDVRDAAARYLSDHSLVYTSLNPLMSGAVPGAGTASRRAPGASGLIAASAAPPIVRRALSNGLVLLVREDRRLPLVSVQASFLGGPLTEAPGAAGLTHLLARTLIKGTKTRGAGEIADAVEGLGGHIGAGAGNNTLSVSLDVMSPDLPIALEILGDVLADAVFPEREVERERAAQLAAIRAERDHLLTVAMHALRAEMFQGHPYAVPRTGTPDSVAALTREDLLRHRDAHVNSGGVVAVFGDVGVDEAVTTVERHLGGLRGGPRGLAAVEPIPSGIGGGRIERTRDRDQAVLVVGFPTGGVLAPDRRALDLLDEACSDMASRLFVRIREEQGLAYYVGASQFLGLAGGAFLFYLGTSPAQIDHAERELLDEIAKLAAAGLDPDELERAKRTYLGKTALEQQSNSALAQTCVLDELYGFGHERHLRLREEVEAVDLRAMAEAAGRRLTAPPTIVRILPPPPDPATASPASSVEESDPSAVDRT